MHVSTSAAVSSCRLAGWLAGCLADRPAVATLGKIKCRRRRRRRPARARAARLGPPSSMAGATPSTTWHLARAGRKAAHVTRSTLSSTIARDLDRWGNRREQTRPTFFWLVRLLHHLVSHASLCFVMIPNLKLFQPRVPVQFLRVRSCSWSLALGCRRPRGLYLMPRRVQRALSALTSGPRREEHVYTGLCGGCDLRRCSSRTLTFPGPRLLPSPRDSDDGTPESLPGASPAGADTSSATRRRRPAPTASA